MLGIKDQVVAGQSTCTILRTMVDTSFALTDRIGGDGWIQLEKMLNEFHAWASETIMDRERTG